MKIAEKLYTQGFISYPRTETNIFPKELDLATLVQNQTQDPNWGGEGKQESYLIISMLNLKGINSVVNESIYCVS